MTDTAIVIDADACVPSGLARALDLIVVPGDAPTLSPTDSIPQLGLDATPSTAEQVVDACVAAAERVRTVLYISANDAFASAPDAGERARAAVTARAPATRFVTQAANSTLMGYGWQAVAAARALSAGAVPEEAIAVAERVRARVHVLAMLEHPELSGVGGVNVPGTARLRALTALRGVAVHVLARPAKREDALIALRDGFAASARADGASLHVAVHHAGAGAGAEALALWVRRTLDPAEVLIAPVTRHAATRFGPRMIGVAWYSGLD
ncbi:MAG: DegV family protein [Dehalococcoidia bacterium]